MRREETSAPVPIRDKQAEEDLWQRYKAERGVWTEPILMAFPDLRVALVRGGI
jgi:hypothetical protein